MIASSRWPRETLEEDDTGESADEWPPLPTTHKENVKVRHPTFSEQLTALIRADETKITLPPRDTQTWYRGVYNFSDNNREVRLGSLGFHHFCSRALASYWSNSYASEGVDEVV